jgi:hypothetical protein
MERKKIIPGWYIWDQWNTALIMRARRAGYTSTQQFILRIVGDVICGKIIIEKEDKDD